MNCKRWIHSRIKFVLLWMLLFFSIQALSQNPFSGLEHLFTTPKSYVVFHTTKGPQVDGDLNDEVWKSVPWTEFFIDIEGDKKGKPKFKTRAKLLWSDSCLYISAEMEEPHIWASLKTRDAIIYHDNDFEVFIDPGNDTHQYFEIEVNAYNTVLDLFMSKPYRNGGTAMLSYNVAGLHSAVSVNGTINNPSDKDKYWTVEMAIPFYAIYIGNYWKAPSAGSLWRINFSRVQWEMEVMNGTYVKKKDQNGKPLPENNWVWSPQGVINMHYPERWGYLLFAKDTVHQSTFVLPHDEKRKQYLWMLYYKQKAFFGKNRKYATTLKELGLNSVQVQVDDSVNELSMEATSRQFSIYIKDQTSTLSINEDGFVQAIKK